MAGYSPSKNWIGTRTYTSWAQMMSRCRNPKATGYKSYGGAGIRVCRRWWRFENFLADMGERPPGKTLDRHPSPGGGYEPGNCRWATPKEQGQNRRKSLKKQKNLEKKMNFKIWQNCGKTGTKGERTGSKQRLSLCQPKRKPPGRRANRPRRPETQNAVTVLVENRVYTTNRGNQQMPDKSAEFLEQMIEQRLKDIADELKNIGIMLEGYKAASDKEVKLAEKLLAGVKHTQQAVNAPHYLSGRWPLRDGDTYGIVAAQPRETTSAEPKVPTNGNDPAGHLRSSDVS